jgi:hypothetical protein
MATVHRVILEPGRRVLPPHDQRIIVVDRVGAQAAQHRLLQLRPRRADGQDHAGALLAGGQGDDLEDLLVDAAGLVHDGEGVIKALQPLRHSRQDLERRSPGRHGQGVRVLLHP